MKYLIKKETHDKNEENTLKELNEVFLMVWFAEVNFYQNTTKN